jgi:hypothetical protein
MHLPQRRKHPRLDGIRADLTVYLIRQRIRQPSVVTGRAAVVRGVVSPDATNTGVLPGVPRTDVNNSSSWPGSGTLQAGYTYSNLNIKYRPSPPVGTLPIHYNNVLFQGGLSPDPGSGNGLCQSTNNGHVPQIFTDCTFTPQNLHWNWNGVIGHHFTALRCDFSGSVDSIGAYNTNNPYRADDLGILIQQCYLHDHGNWGNPPDTSHSDGSHGDGLQQQGGRGVTFYGNHVSGYSAGTMDLNGFGTHHINACMQFGGSISAIGDNDIQYNWFYGGASGLNIGGGLAAYDNTGVGFGIVKNNKFGHDQRSGDTWCIVRPSGLICDFGVGTPEENVFEDTGLPITIRNG